MRQEPEHVTMLRDSLRRFVAAECPKEKVREWDRQRHFPREAFGRLAELGVCGLTFDADYGGAGRDIVAAVAVVEELSRRGLSLAGPYIHTAFYAGMNLEASGSTAQKESLLPLVAEGRMIFAYGLSEPDIGADLAGVRTRAERRGDSILINGAKRWCTAAGLADYILCLCNSDPAGARYANLSLVLVPARTKGITIRPIEHMGIGYAETTDVMFDDVEVPLEHILGGPQFWNRGWETLAGPALDVEKIEVAAMALGIGEAALQDAIEYSSERRQFGKPIGAYQAVRHTLSQCATEMLACRLMVYHAASLANERRPCSTESSMAKLFVTETARKVVLQCQEVLGAYGVADEYDMRRNVSDILVMPIIGGSSNIQRNNIAKKLGLPAR